MTEPWVVIEPIGGFLKGESPYISDERDREKRRLEQLKKDVILILEEIEGSIIQPVCKDRQNNDMSLRDYLAANAPITWEMAHNYCDGSDPSHKQVMIILAQMRYAYADTMMKTKMSLLENGDD